MSRALDPGSRRTTVRALAAGGLAALLGPLGRGATAEAKKKGGKKRKRCPPPDRCPQRRCCACTGAPPSYALIPGVGDAQAACQQACPSGATSIFTPNPGFAIGCTSEGACVALNCPIF